MARVLSVLTSSAIVIGADHQLVEIIFAIDRHKSEQCAGLFRDDDRRLRHQIVAPALAPPRYAGREIDSGIGLLPSLLPQGDRGVFILRAIGAKVKGGAHRGNAVMAGPDPGIHLFGKSRF